MIKVTNVTKKYGSFYAVRNISFTIEDGQIIGLLGKNGAGKTTTMNMLTGFIEATKGKIEIDGFDIEKKPKNAKALIGYMPEGVPLYSDLTVKEFIAYMADLKLVSKTIKKDEIERVMKETGLKSVENKLTRNLSRGYKQRVSLAGALVGNPKILILDEPTVGLDPEQVVEIRELIKSLKKDHTVILSSHILSEISQICEKVIIMDKGEIIAIDTPENLENKLNSKQEISIIVDDPENNIEKIKDTIKDIENITLEKENEDNTKEYKIILSNNVDIRKDISLECLKNNVVIIELKRGQNSLEDAFINIVEGRPNISQIEIDKLEKEKEKAEYKKEKELKKRKKKENKKCKKEDNENGSNN